MLTLAYTHPHPHFFQHASYVAVHDVEQFPLLFCSCLLALGFSPLFLCCPQLSPEAYAVLTIAYTPTPPRIQAHTLLTLAYTQLTPHFFPTRSSRSSTRCGTSSSSSTICRPGSCCTWQSSWSSCSRCVGEWVGRWVCAVEFMEMFSENPMMTELLSHPRLVSILFHDVSLLFVSHFFLAPSPFVFLVYPALSPFALGDAPALLHARTTTHQRVTSQSHRTMRCRWRSSRR